jgi:hypothetical protein
MFFCFHISAVDRKRQPYKAMIGNRFCARMNLKPTQPCADSKASYKDDFYFKILSDNNCYCNAMRNINIMLRLTVLSWMMEGHEWKACHWLLATKFCVSWRMWEVRNRSQLSCVSSWVMFHIYAPQLSFLKRTFHKHYASEKAFHSPCMVTKHWKLISGKIEFIAVKKSNMSKYFFHVCRLISV